MTCDEAYAMIDRMQELWTKWDPTVAQRKIWTDVLMSASEDQAWPALESAYADHGRWREPRASDYRNALNVLSGSRMNRGVYGAGPDEADTGPMMCPYFVMEQTMDPQRAARGAEPYTSTWAYPRRDPNTEDGLPPDSAMHQDAVWKLKEMERMYPKGNWVIYDARCKYEGASEHFEFFCRKQMGWNQQGAGV